MRLKNVSKIGLVIGLMTIAVLISVLLISNKLKKLNKINSNIIQIYTPSLNNLNDLYSSISQSKSLIQSWINIDTYNAPDKEKLNNLHSTIYPALYDTLSQLSKLNDGWPDNEYLKLLEDVNTLIQDSLFSKHRSIMNALSSFSSYRDDYLVYQMLQKVDEDGIVTLTTQEILNYIVTLKKKFEKLINNDGNEIITSYNSLSSFILIVGLILTALAIFLSIVLIRSLNIPLSNTKDTLHLIGQGILPKEKLKEGNNEAGYIAKEINILVQGLKSLLNFSIDIGKGNFSTEFKPLSDKDALGNSLLDMRDELVKASEEDKKRKEEDNERNWASQGIAIFSDILRNFSDNLEKLSFEIIKKIVTYTESNQGGIYIVNDNDPDKIILEMTACYAYGRQKQLQKTIEAGEGLVGRCYQEHDKIYLIDIPEDYITITSGLGEKTPSNLLVIPLTYNDKIFGIIEIASFKIYKEYQIEFIEHIGESIAASILAVKSNVTTRQLLEKSQQQAEEMQAQEEELRQNLEEMQTTQEDLQKKMQENERMSEEIAKEKALMDTLLENAKELIYFKDKESRFIKVSKSMALLFNVKNIEELYGKSDFDFFTEEHARPAFEDEKRIMETGEPIINKVEKETLPDGRVNWVTTSKMPLYDKNGTLMGTFGISKDITDIKNMEQDIRLKNEEMQAQEEELRQNLEEMQTVHDEMVRQKEELNKEKALMDALLNNVKETIYFKDKESRFIKLSKSMAHLFNVNNVEELYGKSDFDFFTEEHARPAFEDEKKIIETGEPIIDKIEKETHADGRLTWASTSKMPLYNQDNEVIGTFGISKDITEIRNMEMDIKQKNEELQATEEELRQNLEEMHTVHEDLERQKEELNKEKSLLDALLNNVKETIYFKDKESRFIKLSNSMAQLFNVKSVEELYGKSDFDFFADEHARPAYEDEQKIIKTGNPIIDKIEKETLPDGRVNWVTTSKMPLYNQNHEIIGTFGISKDITELVNMEMAIKQKNEDLQATEEELRQNLEEMQTIHEDLEKQIKENENIKTEIEQQQKLLLNILNEIPEKLYLKDNKGKFVIANKPVAENYGITPEELIGKSDFDFYPKKEAAGYFKKEKEIIEKGKIEIYEEGDLTKWDKIIVKSMKKPFKIEHLGVTGLFGMQIDITESKKNEMQLKTLNEELKAQEEELRQNLEEIQTIQENMEKRIKDNEKLKDDYEKKIIDLTKTITKLRKEIESLRKK